MRVDRTGYDKLLYENHLQRLRDVRGFTETGSREFFEKNGN